MNPDSGLVLGSTRFFTTRRVSGPEVKGTAGAAHPDPWQARHTPIRGRHGTAHPDPRQARHTPIRGRHGTLPIREPKIKSRDSALNAGEGSRVIESQMKRHTPNTFRHLCKRTHTDIPTCACP